MNQPVDAVAELVARIVPIDDLEAAHQADTLAWLASTNDVYRREKPMTPARHLVSYIVLLDPERRAVLLGCHILSELDLPVGGHVEPEETPYAAARREVLEEVPGCAVVFDVVGSEPLMVTVTQTVGPSSHTDTSLWFVGRTDRGAASALDAREFESGRWWTREEIDAADPGRFDPHMGRFMAKLESVLAPR